MKEDIRVQKEIIIYGAGYCGLLLSDILLQTGEYRILRFMDQSADKAGRSFHNIPVLLPVSCKKMEQDVMVVVGMLKKFPIYETIKNSLLQLGYQNIMHVYDFMQQSSKLSSNNLIFQSDKAILESHKAEITQVYNRLNDEISRRTYAAILTYLAGETEAIIPSYPYEEQYFAYDVYQKIQDEVFVDCGAFRGDILDFFIRNVHNEFERYIAIEPDGDNAARIRKSGMKKDERIQVIQKAISNRKETLHMKNYFNENSVVVSDGDIRVEAETLDSLLEQLHISPTFVKVDIEGYEAKLLQGGEKTLIENNPVVAIAIYHRISDFWRIPLYFMEHFPENKFYIRSYMNVNETCLYSVPVYRRNEMEGGHQ